MSVLVEKKTVNDNQQLLLEVYVLNRIIQMPIGRFVTKLRNKFTYLISNRPTARHENESRRNGWVSHSITFAPKTQNSLAKTESLVVPFEMLSPN